MLTIKNIPTLNAGDLAGSAVQLANIETHPIACNNWPEAFPYSPRAEFRIAHNGKELFLKFSVSEQYTMAKTACDNGEVWTDSCVEFFIAPDNSGYYNFEFNCIGKALLGFRKERPNATHGTPEIMQSIKRLPTLGTQVFDEKNGNNTWELTVAIPITSLFKHTLESWSGLKAAANVYKCGDNLSHPHYLSWKPIDTPTPDFHVARCFSEIEFAK